MYYIQIKSSDMHFLDTLYSEIKANKLPFFLVFFAVVFLTYLVLFVIDFIPEPVGTVAQAEIMEEKELLDTEELEAEEEEPASSEPFPTKIIFDSLDKEVAVLNPESEDIEVLDNALLSGAVRHPASADLTTKGNVFILGHSSYLPNVLNKNFQAFNGIQDLVWGDIIRLQTADAEYVYRVQKVYEAKASEVFVPETPGKAQLTLATCNSFGSKDDRFMVEATLIDTKQL
jgi:LPXTG-site transpeptidase (sortase) family protein